MRIILDRLHIADMFLPLVASSQHNCNQVPNTGQIVIEMSQQNSNRFADVPIV